jgi:putative nucleotidyltransferase-like protein
VGPALGFACKADRTGRLPPTVRARVHQWLVDGTARHLLLSRELARLLEHFDGERIAVIPLKGPALAEALYPDPALRPCSDLDLLIRRETVERVDDLLLGLGYRRRPDAHSFQFDLGFDRATLYEAPSGIRVDLHWGLVSDARYSWEERESLTVWDRAVPIRVAGQNALGLGPEDLFLYLAVHLAVHHALAGLVWYYDLFLILEERAGPLDWDALVERASRWRTRSALYFALLVLEVLFGSRAPAGVMARLEPRGPRAALMKWLLRHRTPRQLRDLEHLIALLLVDRWHDLPGTLRRALFPAPEWLRARYADLGSASRFGYYLAHYRRLATIVGRTKDRLPPLPPARR